MKEVSKQYPAKILLFGEYLIIHNENGLALPFNKFYVSFSKNAKIPLDTAELVEYWKGCGVKLDYETLSSDLIDGLSLQSTIPIGSGLGSSGAVVAAIYDNYTVSPSADIRDLKSVLSKMESYFHGKSSGLDPLVSYLNSVIEIQDGKLIKCDELNINQEIFLWESGIARDTKKLVSIFTEKMKKNDFKAKFKGEFARYNSLLIEGIKRNGLVNKEDLFAFSELQFELFSEMIPPVVRTAWEEGLNNNEYGMKLCGAGGGGFFLIFEFNRGSAKERFNKIYSVDSFISPTRDINLTSFSKL